MRVRSSCLRSPGRIEGEDAGNGTARYSPLIPSLYEETGIRQASHAVIETSHRNVSFAIELLPDANPTARTHGSAGDDSPSRLYGDATGQAITTHYFSEVSRG